VYVPQVPPTLLRKYGSAALGLPVCDHHLLLAKLIVSQRGRCVEQMQIGAGVSWQSCDGCGVDWVVSLEGQNSTGEMCPCERLLANLFAQVVAAVLDWFVALMHGERCWSEQT
jgi:hypothetical protein